MMKARFLGLVFSSFATLGPHVGERAARHMGADIAERCSVYPTHLLLSFVEMLFVILVVYQYRTGSIVFCSTSMSSTQVRASAPHDIHLNMRSLRRIWVGCGCRIAMHAAAMTIVL
ncbi:hypothetical protein IMY05_001G0152900 [Salix suchowensis]|nr:hypothetical protein IMY05_001G0152900 [Salix suchowensis]